MRGDGPWPPMAAAGSLESSNATPATANPTQANPNTALTRDSVDSSGSLGFLGISRNSWGFLGAPHAALPSPRKLPMPFPRPI